MPTSSEKVKKKKGKKRNHHTRYRNIAITIWMATWPRYSLERTLFSSHCSRRPPRNSKLESRRFPVHARYTLQYHGPTSYQANGCSVKDEEANATCACTCNTLDRVRTIRSHFAFFMRFACITVEDGLRLSRKYRALPSVFLAGEQPARTTKRPVLLLSANVSQEPLRTALRELLRLQMDSVVRGSVRTDVILAVCDLSGRGRKLRRFVLFVESSRVYFEAVKNGDSSLSVRCKLILRIRKI